MRRRNGYTLIELVLVLALLVLIAIFVFVLTGSGSQAYLRLTAGQNQDSDLRIGLSYINVKLRGYDGQGMIDVQPDPFGGSPSLLLTREIEGETYLTWIYVREGYLCELFLAESTTPVPEMATRIVAADSLTLISRPDGALQVILTRDGAATAGQRSRTITLRSKGGES